MSECFCDYDPPQFYCSAIRKARREHRCEECAGKILSGEQYEYVSGKWEYFAEFKTCLRCVDLRTWVKNNVPCFCWGHGNLHDDMRETVQDAAWRAGSEVAGLRFGLLRRMTALDKFNAARRNVLSPHTVMP